MAGWRQLPTELRWLIFDFIKEIYNWEEDPRARANYASVCKEWQLIFEAETFQVLTLDQDRLGAFKAFVSGNERRRNYVQGLILRIKLEEYDCTVCETVEDVMTIKRNDEIFIKILWKFLIIMATWRRRPGSNIWLDLGVYSPSDGRHSFRDFRFANNYPYIPGSGFKRNFDEYERHALKLYQSGDACPGWARACRGEHSAHAAKRIMSVVANSCASHFPTLLRPDGQRKAGRPPKVEIITGLSIRRHYTRIISPGMICKILKESFTKLQWLRHEKLPGFGLVSQARLDKGYERLLSHHSSNNLQELFLFEDMNNPLRQINPRTIVSTSLGRTLAATSYNFRKLCVSFLIDAIDFFSVFSTPIKNGRSVTEGSLLYYPNLEYLALTSMTLLQRPFHDAACMLLAAGVAALYCMPKLKVMEIWAAKVGDGCLFRFRKGESLEITWKSSRNAKSISAVLNCWRAMAQANPFEQRDFNVQHESLSGNNIKSYSDFLCELELKNDIIHPISEFQMEWEHK